MCRRPDSSAAGPVRHHVPRRRMGGVRRRQAETIRPASGVTRLNVAAPDLLVLPELVWRKPSRHGLRSRCEVLEHLAPRAQQVFAIRARPDAQTAAEYVAVLHRFRHRPSHAVASSRGAEGRRPRDLPTRGPDALVHARRHRAARRRCRGDGRVGPGRRKERDIKARAFQIASASTPAALAAAAWVHPRLPRTTATHWNLGGHIDGHAPTGAGLHGVALLLAVSLATPIRHASVRSRTRTRAGDMEVRIGFRRHGRACIRIAGTGKAPRRLPWTEETRLQGDDPP